MAPTETTARSAAFLTVPEIAEQLGIDAGKVLHWINSGQLPGIDISETTGGRPRWRFAVADFAAFLAARKTQPTAVASPKRPRKSRPRYY